MQNTSSLCIFFSPTAQNEIICRILYRSFFFLYDTITSVNLVTTNKSNSANGVTTIPIPTDMALQDYR